MKKLLGILVLSLLVCSNSVAEISYICTYEEDVKKEPYVFEIKKRKLYLEGNFQKTKYLKTSSSKTEFRYESKIWIRSADGSKERSNYDTTHKINLKTGSAIETVKSITEYLDKSGKIIRTEKKNWTDTLSCYGGTLNIAKGDTKPKKKKPEQKYPDNKILRAASGTGFFCIKNRKYSNK